MMLWTFRYMPMEWFIILHLSPYFTELVFWMATVYWIYKADLKPVLISYTVFFAFQLRKSDTGSENHRVVIKACIDDINEQVQ